jgi:hypothetical protein
VSKPQVSRPANVPRFALAIAAAIAIACAQPALAKLVVMHGYADATSAPLWISGGPRVIKWPGAVADGSVTRTRFASAANENIVVARLTACPRATVRYRQRRPGQPGGTLRTQLAWTDPKSALDITIAIGSCFFRDPNLRHKPP